MKTRVVIVDDHTSVREMVALVLAGEKSPYEVVGHARTGVQGRELCKKRKPDLVIFDLILPEMSGVELLRCLRPDMPKTRWLVYSGVVESHLACSALHENPHGFVHKRDELRELREALRAVASGHCYIAPHATMCRDCKRKTDYSINLLTAREREVLRLIADGLTSAAMADELNVHPRTIDHHRSNVMKKLNIHDIARLTRFAIRAGLVTD